MERTEATGFGVAAVGHVALIAALMLLLDKSGSFIPPPAMEVSFAEDVGLVSTAPDTEASAPAFSEDTGPVEEASGADSSVPEAEAIPEPEVSRTPSPSTPRDRPEEPRRTARSNVPSQPRPQPQRTQPQRTESQRSQPQRSTPPGRGPAQQTRRSGLPNLNSFNTDGEGRSQQPSGAMVTAQVSGNIAGALRAAFTPCANRAALPADEARSIFVTVRVTLNRDGSLANIDNIRVRNPNPDLARYEQRMRELTLGIVRCATPVRQLASQLGEYYDVPRGWRVSDYTFPQRR